MLHEYENFSHTSGIPLPDVVVWDMDGTLLKASVSKHIASDQESNARRVLTSLDFTYKTARNLKNMVVPTFHLDKNLKTKLLSYAMDKHAFTPGTLDTIGDYGIKQALVSNNSRTAVGDKVLSLFEIRDRFAATIFREDMNGSKKPDPEILRTLSEKIDIAPDDVIWVVGDSRTDMRFAIAGDETLPNIIIPVAMGLESRAAKFLESGSHDGHCAILSDPMDLCVITAMLPQALEMHDESYMIDEADDHLGL